MDNIFLIMDQTFWNKLSEFVYIINIHLEKKCWFKNWIFKNFFLDIYRGQMDYSMLTLSPEDHLLKAQSSQTKD